MGDNAEEMLNVTMKRIEYVMDTFTAEEALKAETHNLISAAIDILRINAEHINTEKAAESWKKLYGWAKSLFVESVIIRRYGLVVGQFHLSGKLMMMMCKCMYETDVIEKEMKGSGTGKSMEQYQELVKRGVEHFQLTGEKEFLVFKNEERKLNILGINRLLKATESESKKGKTRIVIDYDPEFPLCFVRCTPL